MRVLNLQNAARNPWSSGLLTATAFSITLVFANVLWESGNAQWSFVLGFGMIWLLSAMLWSNDNFNQESNLMLAEIVDHNVNHLFERLKELESSIESLQHTLLDQESNSLQDFRNRTASNSE